jgi:hypothetical protein
MNWNAWIRQFHRWVAIAFTLTVIANFVAMGLGEPPAWVVYSPLFRCFCSCSPGCICSCCHMPSGGAAVASAAQGGLARRNPPILTH